MNQPPVKLSPATYTTDPDSLEDILRRSWARKAEQARLQVAQASIQVHPVPPRVEATLPPWNGQSEDKETANLLSDELTALSISPATSSEEPDVLETLTEHGPDAEATADLADAVSAPSSATPNGGPGFTQGLQNGKSNGAKTALTDEIKEFIVKGLACYDTPSQVAEAVNQMFGVTVSRQRVYRYVPDNPRPPAQRWRDLHAATRQALLRELADIGVAHRAVRLRRLDRLASRSERHNVMMALKCLEMAAKECGGMYENRRRVAPQVPMPLPQFPAPIPALPMRGSDVLDLSSSPDSITNLSGFLQS
ncbi:DUF2280 domain-containing protein [Dongia sedimenti]|uniref:DUF2280 domain-containing protein n=1 Tax=Dongia sedimenti TaxID=3064282 RepID=A0ABU0YM32_9PROT|nr:DUF2280 domain-containing protein [Rhodospirillaceae bacterium R-7]